MRCPSGSEGTPSGGGSRQVVKVGLRCCYCHDRLERGEAACCAACLAPHHAACFSEHGRCTTAGCGERLTVTPGPPASGRERAARGDETLGLQVLLALTLLAGGSLALARRGPRPPRSEAPARGLRDDDVFVSHRELPTRRDDVCFVPVDELSLRGAPSCPLSLVSGGYEQPIALAPGGRLLLEAEGGFVTVRVADHTGRRSLPLLVVSEKAPVCVRLHGRLWPLERGPAGAAAFELTCEGPRAVAER